MRLTVSSRARGSELLTAGATGFPGNEHMGMLNAECGINENLYLSNADGLVFHSEFRIPHPAFVLTPIGRERLAFGLEEFSRILFSLTKQNISRRIAPVEGSQLAAQARDVLALYPRIYFACHTRHVRDPETQWLLSRHQASILDHLDEIDAITVNDLARHMGVTAGTMSLAIDRLEKKGYVMRLRDTVDRRRVQLRLTSAGVRVRQATTVLDPPRVEALLARLTPGEREAAVHGLRLLADAAGRTMDQETGGRR